METLRSYYNFKGKQRALEYNAYFLAKKKIILMQNLKKRNLIRSKISMEN